MLPKDLDKIQTDGEYFCFISWVHVGNPDNSYSTNRNIIVLVSVWISHSIISNTEPPVRVGKLS